MSRSVTVKVSSRNQIAVPKVARERLDIQSGDRLLVDVQDGVLILVPQPEKYAERLAGLHSDLWSDIESEAYLEGERDAWAG